MTIPFFRSRTPLRVVAFALTAALAACGDSPSGSKGPGAPARLDVLTGDSQEAVVGTELPNVLVVRVSDDDGKPVPGQVINFRVVSGGGSVFAGTAQTNAAGEARERWTLGTSTAAADSQRVEVRAVDPANGAAVVYAVFRAVAKPAAAAAITPVGSASRNGTAGDALADSLSARVADRYGNPVPGAPVVWSVRSGGGTISPLTSVTGADGISRASWTLGARADSAQEADAAMDMSTRASFVATAGLPAMAVLEVTGGSGQTGVVGTTLTEPLVATVRLSDGRPLRGATVTWNAGALNGSVTPPVSTTDAEGRATARWTLGTIVGTGRVVASVPGAAPVSYTGAAVAGSPARIAAAGNAPPSVAAGTQLPQPVAVHIVDSHGNPVPGQSVTWTVELGGGSVSAASSTTDAAGIARTSWTVGTRVGEPQRLAATSGALPRVTFSTNVTAGPAALLTKTAGDGGTAGVTSTRTLEARVTDAHGNSIPLHAVNWRVVSGGGSLAAGMSTTNPTGTASMTWRLGASVGNQSVSATITSGTQTSSVTYTVAAGGVLAKSVESGSSEAGTLRSAAVMVTDGAGTPIPNIRIEWAVGAGGGTLTVAQSVTNMHGTASAEWVLGGVLGRQTLTASASGLTNSPVTFSVDAVPGRVDKLAFRMLPTAIQLGVPVSPAIQVVALDRFGNVATNIAGAVTLQINAPDLSKVWLATQNGHPGITAQYVNGVATFTDVTLTAHADFVTSEERFWAFSGYPSITGTSEPFTVRR